MSDIPTSGAISLNQMHTEVDGVSGTIASINDADIRALIGKGSGVTMSFNEWYGASSALDTQTVTVGYSAGNSYFPTFYGYNSALVFGSISDGTLNPLANKTISNLYWNDYGNVVLSVTGYYANSGFTTMNVAGTSFNRTSATYTGSSNGSQWVWANITTNPFGTTVGATKTVVFS